MDRLIVVVNVSIDIKQETLQITRFVPIPIQQNTHRTKTQVSFMPIANCLSPIAHLTRSSIL